MKMKKKLIGFLVFCLLVCSLSATSFAAEKPYYITVNLTENIVTVYEKDTTGKYTVPVKAFYCSGGGYTPEGTFRTTQKYDWRILFGDVWGQYATRITGHILFHSVPYFEKDKSTLEYEEYNKLGTTASAGCIRLCVADAKWIYDNCPVGTTVKMYRGKVTEPLQPETPKKIDTTDLLRRGWDPTDPDVKNPWKKGEMRELTLKTPKAERGMKAYYEKGTYYLTAQDAKQMFAHLGITLILSDAEARLEEGKMMIRYQKELHAMTCHVENGEIYYKMRDLADLVGAEMTWEAAKKEIGISYNGREIIASRNLTA